MGKSGSHELSQHFKKFLDAFGMEWREVKLSLVPHGHTLISIFIRLPEKLKPSLLF